LAVVPNPYANYIVTPIDNKFGELLVLRFIPPQTPIDTCPGKPSPSARWNHPAGGGIRRNAQAGFCPAGTVGWVKDEKRIYCGAGATSQSGLPGEFLEVP